jgi:hypothetical protein
LRKLGELLNAEKENYGEVPVGRNDSQNYEESKKKFTELWVKTWKDKMNLKQRRCHVGRVEIWQGQVLKV